MSAVNERILDEIKSLKVNSKMKEFLEKILNFELDIMDQGRPNFSTQYNQILEEVFF
jgi:hypothetical protein